MVTNKNDSRPGRGWLAAEWSRPATNIKLIRRPTQGGQRDVREMCDVIRWEVKKRVSVQFKITQLGEKG